MLPIVNLPPVPVVVVVVVVVMVAGRYIDA